MKKVWISLFLAILLPAAALGAAERKHDPRQDMILVKGGCFEMGDPYTQATRLDGDPDEKPTHTVCLSDYHIGKYEVTRGEYERFVDDTGYKTEAERGQGCFIIYGGRVWLNQKDLYWERLKQDDDHPVACVSWNDADEFIKWKNKKTGLKFRLPTEAEWEFAARSRGKVYKYSWGDGGPEANVADEAARKELPEVFPESTYWKGYDDGYVFSSPVGKFKPNGLGIYDMSGNVWEWTNDLYDVDYYKKSPRDNPRGNMTDGSRVRKGGSWADDRRHQRVANRSRSFQFRARFDLGFRLVMEP
ncbi:MAG: formylglycine-generating enzyme family protein [Deltaproteobacteria bacterium]|nr:formylglycine-generating enzyme family protein [Deltaproteobacteria bacterium]